MIDQYSAAVAVKNLLQNRDWFGKFEFTDQFDELTSIEQQHAFSITNAITELVYLIQLKPLGKWTANDLEEILTYNLPVQISAQADFFTAVEPVMAAYLSFLGKTKHITNQNVLLERLREVAPTMVAYSNDDNLWSANKILGMQMIYGDVPLKAASDLAEFEETTNCGVPIIKATAPRPKHQFSGNVVELNSQLRAKYQKEDK